MFLRVYDIFQTCEKSENHAVMQKLNQFKNHITRFETLRSLRIDWEKYPFKIDPPSEAVAAASSFGGEVTGWDE